MKKAKFRLGSCSETECEASPAEAHTTCEGRRRVGCIPCTHLRAGAPGLELGVGVRGERGGRVRRAGRGRRARGGRRRVGGRRHTRRLLQDGLLLLLPRREVREHAQHGVAYLVRLQYAWAIIINETDFVCDLFARFTFFVLCMLVFNVRVNPYCR